MLLKIGKAMQSPDQFKHSLQTSAMGVVNYSATKGADEIFNHLKPLIKELLSHSKFIDKLLKG